MTARLAVALAFAAMLAGCQPATTRDPVAVEPAEGVDAPRVGMANPASVACVRNGGDSRIVTAADGSQSGYCHFPDGRVCEEWALFRDGRCIAPPADAAANRS